MGCLSGARDEDDFQSYAATGERAESGGPRYGVPMPDDRGSADDDAAADPFDTDFEPDDDTAPSWFPGGHLPPDAQRMGLTAHVPDGALLDFAGRLDAGKTLHRVTAWLLLLVFGLPVLMYIVRLAQELVAS